MWLTKVRKQSELDDWPIHSFIHSFHKYLLGTYYVPDKVWRLEDTTVNKTDLVPKGNQWRYIVNELGNTGAMW